MPPSKPTEGNGNWKAAIATLITVSIAAVGWQTNQEMRLSTIEANRYTAQDARQDQKELFDTYLSRQARQEAMLEELGRRLDRIDEKLGQ